MPFIETSTFPSKLFKLLPHLSPHLLLGICPPSPPIPSQCRQCPFNVFNLSSQCPQHFTPFRSQAPNEMRLRQRVKGSLPNLPLEACLSSTGWYVVWKSRRLAALSHVTIAVGAPGPVTCHRVMRGTRERISRIWTSLEPRGPGPGMVAPVWALTHCAHCAGERLARACNTRTRGRIRGQSGAQEDRARRRNLGEEMRSSLGTLRNLESSGRFLGGEREPSKVLENLY